MNFHRRGLSMSLVPDEMALYFEITGCPLRCKGCHSPELRDATLGKVLDEGELSQHLERFKSIATVVVFLGGDQYNKELPSLLRKCKERGFKTCLYTGRTIVSKEIKEQLDYVKLGPYVSRRGGLESKNTNQVFIDMNTGEKLNNLFWRE